MILNSESDLRETHNMKNFDLKQYLTENKLLKEDGAFETGGKESDYTLEDCLKEIKYAADEASKRKDKTEVQDQINRIIYFAEMALKF